MGMRRVMQITGGLLLALLVNSSGLAETEADTEAEADVTSEQPHYTIHPGDILQISVWQDESLTREALVRPDGRFSFPLAGDVVAVGKNAEEIKDEIAERIERFIPDPVVTVAVDQIQGNKIFVLGKVNRPGEFVISGAIDVMQALTLAGGTSTFAGLNKIKILRRVDGEQIAIPFKYEEVAKGKNLEQNVLLQAGDVVVVP